MWLNTLSLPTNCGCSPSAPAEEVLTSDSTSQLALLASSVGLNGKPSPLRTWRGLWTKAAWLRLLCGRTCEPSTAQRGVERWIASLRATPASHFPSLAEDVDRRIVGICGPTSAASLAKWNRESCFSKTCPAISPSDSERSPETLKAWATRLRRASLRRRKSARRTGASGCSSSAWPTATVNGNHNRAGLSENSGDGLATAALNWPIPTAGCTTGAGAQGRDGGLNLQSAAALWPTPNVPNGGRVPAKGSLSSTGMNPNGEKRQVDLSYAATDLWPTPDASVAQDGESPETWLARREILREAKKNGNGCGTPLAMAVQPYSRPDLPTETHGEKCCDVTTASLRLSPRFVCWLMGWPLIEPDGSVCTETEWCLYRQRMRSALCGLLSALAESDTGSDGGGTAETAE